MERGIMRMERGSTRMERGFRFWNADGTRIPNLERGWNADSKRYTISWTFEGPMRISLNHGSQELPPPELPPKPRVATVVYRSHYRSQEGIEKRHREKPP